MESDKFLIAGKHYLSRLLVGTGKYKDFKETQKAISESGAEIVTVAIRRTNIGQDIKEESLLDFIPKENILIYLIQQGVIQKTMPLEHCVLQENF